MTAEHITPDSEHRGLVGALPPALRDYALLARFDRPIGWWLLFWPCAWGVWLTGAGAQWQLVAWLLLGSIAMRGAGCVYNDIVDADLDRQVARTAVRPVASGRVSKRAAWVWLLVLAAVGLVVLLQLRWQAQLVALASLLLVAAYPFMKRITWWPQAWLGLVFTWGALVGWTALRADLIGVALALYAGAFFWCMAYDTIYALQDREDDALVGIKSSALRLGDKVQAGVALFYALAVACFAFSFWLLRADWLALLALVPVALHFGWQVATLDPADGMNPLVRFRSNRWAGALMAAACFVVGNA
ncbi:4-hydroxybenzoate octaprenyltransferase [Altererythrobacter sp. KTW20L]|uniref:4-hydroxybenzoate octaprenyltransferase n=1 Tax=Altererythrobacter sp. KTW20L TaxID=2942210 RepID=UPI0020BE6682|nr:4-hydroxybenzoate octaprenyltransferase [Altererythrobacter sp. KTW20L]MCL6250633.1 4-hydroxybenzoate octaprenyltransferase [Altererythrobacter sp. KTW20L]